MDYYSPDKAVVIAGSRVGSTMLCNALDSHPLISCDRSEPLNPTTSPYLKVGLSAIQTLDIVLSRPGFQWCMCKVSYRQLRKQVSLQQLVDLGVTKFIHLWRENPLRVVVSAALNTRSWQEGYSRPTHAWTTPEIQTIQIPPESVLMQGTLYLERVEFMKEALSMYESLTLTYEHIIRGNFLYDIPHNELLDFLQVRSVPLVTYTKQINPYPLSRIVENWSEVCETLRGTILEKWTEE